MQLRVSMRTLVGLLKRELTLAHARRLVPPFFLLRADFILELLFPEVLRDCKLLLIAASSISLKSRNKWVFGNKLTEILVFVVVLQYIIIPLVGRTLVPNLVSEKQ